MARIDIENPFDRKLEPKGFIAAKMLLSGKLHAWNDLSAAADGLSTRTLGAINKRFAEQGITLEKTRKQNDGGTFYQATQTGKPARTKKGPKVARPAKADPPKATAEKAEAVSPTKTAKLKSASTPKAAAVKKSVRVKRNKVAA